MNIERKFMITNDKIKRLWELYYGLDHKAWISIFSTTFQDEESGWFATGPEYNSNSGPGEMDDFDKARNDAEFIIAAYNALPELLDEIERLQDLVDNRSEHYHGSCCCCATY